MATLQDWIVMCCSEPEFIAQYNRLYGSRISFEIPQRTPIERMVDQACGLVPEPTNDPAELRELFNHLTDLFGRIYRTQALEA